MLCAHWAWTIPRGFYLWGPGEGRRELALLELVTWKGAGLCPSSTEQPGASWTAASGPVEAPMSKPSLAASPCSKAYIPRTVSTRPYTKQPLEWEGMGGGEGCFSVKDLLLPPGLCACPSLLCLWLAP